MSNSQLNHPQEILFTKMQGLGNDFVVLDALKKPITVTPSIIQAMADRHFGIGCDQVLLLEPTHVAGADVTYRIFNSDGAEVEQCGNGARCVAAYLWRHHLVAKREIVLATSSGLLVARWEAECMVAVNMGVPTFIPAEIPFIAPEEAAHYSLELKAGSATIMAVGLGNPHAVLQVAEIEKAPVAILGREIECHPRFPQRANVGFMQILSPSEIKLRVFERGVGETLACGSGACAAMVAGHHQRQLAKEVLVRLPGGQLFVSWAGEGTPVWMKGPAVEVFTGAWL